jgi:hypothetical protein
MMRSVAVPSVAPARRANAVSQGMENTVGGVRARSSISREIVEDSSGDLKIAESAWFKVTG